MISLETYNKSQLKELINSEKFKEFSFYPITVHRAISHINNPNISDETTILILAFFENNLAGYIGIMADKMFHKNEKIPIGWLSTLFVHPNFRGKSIAQKLLNKACNEYDGKILITEFTPEAENIYKKSGLFLYQKPLKGMSYHFLSNLKEILPVKNIKWKKVLLLLKLFDVSVNSVVKLLYFFQSYKIENYEVANILDEDSKKFIAQNQKKNCFGRGLSEIDWIVNFPWILNCVNSEEKVYQFSAFEKKFKYVFIKVYKDKILKTLLMISIRNKNAKLHFAIGENNVSESTQILHHFIFKNNITNFICFDEEINKYLHQKNILFKKERNRKFLMHQKLYGILDSDYVFDVSAVDGDAIFT